MVMKRTPMKRGTKPLKANPEKTREWQQRSRKALPTGDKPLERTEMKSTVSKKTKAFRAEMEGVRPLVEERSHGMCEIRLPQVCQGRATNIHHRLPRGAGGTNSKANLLHLCGSGTTGCHGWVESHRKEAYELGLLLRRGENPEERGYTVPKKVSG
jgi:hypothetical protein